MTEEVCGVCKKARADHEPSHHLFSVEGKLLPKPKTTAAPRETAQAVSARLALTLARKGLLDEGELAYVLTGIDPEAINAKQPGDRAHG